MTRILFVDDESRVLDGLRRTLHGHRDRWQMTFALGAEAALAAMEAAPFDIVISDMRMPHMDGLALLTVARSRWPSMARIVLSGHMDMAVAVRAASVAHQCLAKPCDAAMLEAAVARTQRGDGSVGDDVLRTLVGEVGALATRPAVYAALERLIADPAAGLGDVSAVIEREVALTAKVLQLVNSSFFGLPRAVASVEHAVAYLGVNVIRGLVLSHELADMAGAHALAPGFSPTAHQAHALRVATLARRVAGRGAPADDAFLAGVLHDVGELLLAMHRREWFVEAGAHAQQQQLPLHAAEIACFGVSHADVGARLVALWGLPLRIVEAIAQHHAPVPTADGAAVPVALAAVHVAEQLVGESDGASAASVPLDDAAVARLGLPAGLSAWREALAGQGAPAA